MVVSELPVGRPGDAELQAAAKEGLRGHAASLFPEDPPRPGLSRWGWLSALAVVTGAVVGLGRVPSGPGVLNTVWAEDGSAFLTDAWMRNEFEMVLHPHAGYFVMGTRILAIPASWAPIEWGPAVLTIEAALVTGLMAVTVYLASRQHLRHPLARLIASAPVVAAPVGENVAAAASNNAATLQFAAAYTALWLVLWVPKRSGAQLAALIGLGAVCASTFLAVIALPLALLRLYARRDRISAVMVGGMLLAVAANVTALAIGKAARPPMMPSRWDPLWALQGTFEWALPHALFGYGITGRGGRDVHPSWLMPASWVVVAFVLLLAALRVTRPQWRIAAVMGLAAIGFTAGTMMQYGGTELRYVVAPELMLFAALAALVLPRPDRPRRIAWAPLVALSACVALVFAFSYRTASPRAREIAPWDESVARARAACHAPMADRVYINPFDGSATVVIVGEKIGRLWGFPVFIPCKRLR